jgi:hypothetical protein
MAKSTRKKVKSATSSKKIKKYGSSPKKLVENSLY